jgi:hypothetical protein
MWKRPRWRPSRVDTLLVGFACMLALITAMGLQVRPFTYLWVSLYTGIAVAVLSVSLTGRLEKQYRDEHEATLAAKQDLQRLSARLVAAQEQERQTLSRELHDQVGQALTAIKIDVARAEQGLLPSQSDLIERLRRARKGAEETLEIIRRLSMLLRPSMLDDLGLSAALGWYTKQFSGDSREPQRRWQRRPAARRRKDQLVQDRAGSPHQLRAALGGAVDFDSIGIRGATVYRAHRRRRQGIHAGSQCARFGADRHRGACGGDGWRPGTEFKARRRDPHLHFHPAPKNHGIARRAGRQPIAAGS